MRSKRTVFALFFFVLIGLLPFLAAAIYALLYSLGLIGVLNRGFTLEHWISILEGGSFLKSLGLSVYVAATTTLLSLVFALLLTLGLRNYFNKPLFSFALYLPLAVPGVVGAFFSLQWLSQTGFLSRISYKFDWLDKASDFPNLVNDPAAFGIIATFTALVTPFFSLYLKQIYDNEGVEKLVRLAKSLGASSKQALFRVELPLLLQKSKRLLFLYFIFILGAYEVPLILGRQSPQMLSVLVVRELKQFDLYKISEGYAAAFFYTAIVCLAALLIFSRKSKRDWV